MPTAKNVEEYIAMQRMAIASNPDCGNSHYNLAVALIGQKKYDEAEGALLDAVECSPNLAEAYVQLGGICLHRGDLEGCLNYNNQAIHSRAGFSEGYGNIGFVHLQMGNIDEAIQALEKAVRWNPHFIQALSTLGNAYLMKGMTEECIQINQKALDLQPDFAIVHNNMAIAFLEREEYDRAAEHCDRAVELGYEVAPQILEEIEEYKKAA